MTPVYFSETPYDSKHILQIKYFAPAQPSLQEAYNSLLKDPQFTETANLSSGLLEALGTGRGCRKPRGRMELAASGCQPPKGRPHNSSRGPCYLALSFKVWAPNFGPYPLLLCLGGV